MFIYVIECKRPGVDDKPIHLELQAPDLFTAFQILQSEWPGTHVIRFVGSYIPGMGGTA